MRIRDRVHTDGHAPSYYAATNRYPGGFRRLEGNHRAEVCIIGGGFTGVATALALIEKGIDVALVEQNLIGWGASGRNGGQVLGGFGPELSDYEKYEAVYGKAAAKVMWDAGVECVDIIAQTVQRYHIDCDLTWGYFDAAMNEREMRGLEEAKASLEARGYPHKLELIDAAARPSVIGSDRFIGGLVNTGWGHCHPLNLVRGEAQIAESLGARIFEDARVSRLEFNGSSVTADMDWCRVTADKIVIACNAYLGDMVPKLSGRMLPVGSYIIATEPLTEEQANRILPGNHAVCDQRWALDYFRLSADRRLLFGGVASYSGLHPKSVVKKMRPKMLKVFPELEDVKIDYEWGGYLAVGLNRIPQVGRLDERCFYAQAYAGHGVAPSHVAAHMIAEAITGNDERLAMIEAVKHHPFPGGRFLRTPLLVAGMAFEQVKEMLR